jgi:hypothetical protein
LERIRGPVDVGHIACEASDLGIERVQALLQALVGGQPGIDNAANPLLCLLQQLPRVRSVPSQLRSATGWSAASAEPASSRRRRQSTSRSPKASACRASLRLPITPTQMAIRPSAHLEHSRLSDY